MANQNPQPEIYTTKHFFNGTAEGATNTQTVFTQQANNEEVRIYGFSVDITDVAGATYTTNVDFDLGEFQAYVLAERKYDFLIGSSFGILHFDWFP